MVPRGDQRLLNLARIFTRGADVSLQINDRAVNTFVNACLMSAERNFLAPEALHLVWAQGGGLETTFVRVEGGEDRPFILHGELELRIRSLQHDALSLVWGDGLDLPRLRGAQLRIAAELVRYDRPEMVTGLLAAAEEPEVHPVHLALPYELEAWSLDERYVALWGLAILHESGHWYASYAMRRHDVDVSSFLQQRFGQQLSAVKDRLAGDAVTAGWVKEFDAGAVSELALVDEGLADQLMADVFFEVVVNCLGDTNWGLQSDPATIDFDIAAACVWPATLELLRWFVSIEWRLRLEHLLGLGRPEPLGHQLVLLELRREALITDFVAYLTDPARFGGLGYEFEGVELGIRAQAESLAYSARTALEPTFRWLADRLADGLPEGNPSPRTVESYFAETLRPRAQPLKHLIARTGASPAHYAPT